MAPTSRLTALRGLARAVRIASRPGGPSMGARLAAVPRMVLATARGDYRGVTVARLLGLTVAVGYLVSPVDLLPEALLGVVGLADDAVVLGWLATQLVTETESFLDWERAAAASGPGGSASRTVPGDVVR